MQKTDLGPRPTSPRTGRVMSPSRVTLLETLRAQPEPTSLAALGALTGLHRNTVREHMDALLRDGFITRHRAPAMGRGRPAWLYAADATDATTEEYAGLAGALAAVLERTSSDPAADAVTAGTEWGRDLSARLGDVGPTDDPEAARDRVLAVFRRMGFAPEEQDGDDVRLTRCPLLEAAHRSPTVVCNVHVGIIRGVMETLGQDGSGSVLEPFAEPGACRLHLEARPVADPTELLEPAAPRG